VDSAINTIAKLAEVDRSRLACIVSARKLGRCVRVWLQPEIFVGHVTLTVLAAAHSQASDRPVRFVVRWCMCWWLPVSTLQCLDFASLKADARGRADTEDPTCRLVVFWQPSRHEGPTWLTVLVREPTTSPVNTRASTPLKHGVSQVERRRRESRVAVGGEACGSGEGLCPFPENLWIFHLKIVWYGADENDSDLRYSLVPLKGKNKTLVKMLGVVNTGRPLQVKYWGSRPLQPLRRWGLWVNIFFRNSLLWINEL